MHLIYIIVCLEFFLSIMLVVHNSDDTHRHQADHRFYKKCAGFIFCTVKIIVIGLVICSSFCGCEKVHKVAN